MLYRPGASPPLGLGCAVGVDASGMPSGCTVEPRISSNVVRFAATTASASCVKLHGSALLSVAICVRPPLGDTPNSASPALANAPSGNRHRLFSPT